MLVLSIYLTRSTNPVLSMTRFSLLVLSLEMTRSLMLVLSNPMTRSDRLVLSDSMTRSPASALSTEMTRSPFFGSLRPDDSFYDNGSLT